MNTVTKYLFLLWAAIACTPGCRTEVRETIPAPEPSPASPFVIVPGERVGSITALSTESSLKEDYGAKNLTIRSMPLGESGREEGVVLFPGTPNEAEIFWDVEAANGHPAFVRISQDSTRWHTDAGVSIGTPLWELERLNGGPFSLNGFEWDLAGLVTDWNGGKFNEHLIIVLIPGNFEAITPELTGEQVRLFSNDLRLKPLELSVGAMAITFAGQRTE